MKCPFCGVTLIRSGRFGSKSLACPECCGEWVPPRLVERLERAESARREAPEPGGRRPPPEACSPCREDLFNWF
jgi:Zn-finger nucleic acid-binding protein